MPGGIAVMARRKKPEPLTAQEARPAVTDPNTPAETSPLRIAARDAFLYALPLTEIANGVKKLPREWINEDGISMNFQFLRYAQPLIQGEVTLPYDSGVPLYARLDKRRVEKSLPPYDV